MNYTLLGQEVCVGVGILPPPSQPPTLYVRLRYHPPSFPIWNHSYAELLNICSSFRIRICLIFHTHVYDDSFAIVMVVDDRVEVVLAGVLRILVHAWILVDR